MKLVPTVEFQLKATGQSRSLPTNPDFNPPRLGCNTLKAAGAVNQCPQQPMRPRRR